MCEGEKRERRKRNGKVERKYKTNIEIEEGRERGRRESESYTGLKREKKEV